MNDPFNQGAIARLQAAGVIAQIEGGIQRPYKRVINGRTIG